MKVNTHFSFIYNIWCIYRIMGTTTHATSPNFNSKCERAKSK